MWSTDLTLFYQLLYSCAASKCLHQLDRFRVVQAGLILCQGYVPEKCHAN